MSKQIALIPLVQISRLEIEVTNCRKSLSEVKAETGADYILNGGMWNGDGTPCAGLKVDGKWESTKPWSSYGYAWDSGPDIMLTLDRGAPTALWIGVTRNVSSPRTCTPDKTIC